MSDQQPPPPQQPLPGYGYGYPAYVPPPPSHPKATTAMVLGIIAVAGGLACYLPLFVAPFAWVTGARAVREIDASGGALGGRSEANTGKILGIVGSVFLALALLVVIVLVVLTFTVDDFWSNDST